MITIVIGSIQHNRSALGFQSRSRTIVKAIVLTIVTIVINVSGSRLLVGNAVHHFAPVLPAAGNNAIRHQFAKFAADIAWVFA